MDRMDPQQLNDLISMRTCILPVHTYETIFSCSLVIITVNAESSCTGSCNRIYIKRIWIISDFYVVSESSLYADHPQDYSINIIRNGQKSNHFSLFLKNLTHLYIYLSILYISVLLPRALYFAVSIIQNRYSPSKNPFRNACASDLFRTTARASSTPNHVQASISASGCGLPSSTIAVKLSISVLDGAK